MKFLSALALLLVMPLVAQAQNQQYLFVTEPAGIESFAINATTGALVVAPGNPFADPNGPVAAAANPASSFLFAANANATVSVFQIATSGALGEISGSPFATIAGSGTLPGAIAVSADGNFLYVASSIDLDISTNTGEMDIFSIQSNGSLVPVTSLPSPAPPLVGVIVSQTSKFLYICSGSGIIQQYGVNPSGTLTQLVALSLPSDGANSCVSDGQLIFVSRNVQSDATGWIDSVGINADGSLTYLTTYKAGLFVSENDLAVQGGFLFSSANTYSVSLSDGNLTPTNLNWINDPQPSPLVASPTAPFLFQGSLPQFTNLVYPFLIASDGSLTNAEPPRILAGAPIGLTVATGTTPAPSNPAFVFEPASLNFSPVAASGNAVAQLAIYSTGSLPLEISNISVTGSGFSQQSTTCGSTLAPGAICYTYISFAPPTAGSFTGRVTLTGNVSGVFEMTGTGVGIQVSAVGPGTVTQTPLGSAFVSGTAITLTATPNIGASFSGWSGACSGATPTCALVLSANSTITATFAANSTPPVTPSIGISPTSQAGHAGHIFQYQITATGFTNPPQMTVSCAIPKATCTLSGAILTVATMGPTTSALPAIPWTWPLVMCALTAAYMLLRGRQRTRKTALVVAALAICGACGGSGSTSKTVLPTTIPGTPTGSYSIVIAAMGSTVTASANLSVTQ
jgi:6-phosphogluconolactonase (cycloisomerase 2 family)